LGILSRLVRARDRGRIGYTATELSRMVRRDLDTIMRLLSVLEQREWIARLHRDGAFDRWLLIVHPAALTVSHLFDLLVVDRAELAFQAHLESSRIDGATLLSALEQQRPDVSLLDLMRVHNKGDVALPLDVSAGAAHVAPELLNALRH